MTTAKTYTPPEPRSGSRADDPKAPVLPLRVLASDPDPRENSAEAMKSRARKDAKPAAAAKKES